MLSVCFDYRVVPISEDDAAVDPLEMLAELERLASRGYTWTQWRGRPGNSPEDVQIVTSNPENQYPFMTIDVLHFALKSLRFVVCKVSSFMR